MPENTAVCAKIAIVDVARIITHDPEALTLASREWSDLFTALQETLKPAMQEIAHLEEHYKKKIAELEALQKQKIAELESLQKSGMSRETVHERHKALQQMLRKKYEEEAAPVEYQLQNKHHQHKLVQNEELYKAQAVVLAKVEKAIDALCDARGWDFAISKGVLPSRRVPARFDITDDVLNMINTEYAAEKAKK